MLRKWTKLWSTQEYIQTADTSNTSILDSWFNEVVTTWKFLHTLHWCEQLRRVTQTNHGHNIILRTNPYTQTKSHLRKLSEGAEGKCSLGCEEAPEPSSLRTNELISLPQPLLVSRRRWSPCLCSLWKIIFSKNHTFPPHKQLNRYARKCH